MAHIYLRIHSSVCLYTQIHAHTQTHTEIYIYIYIYAYRKRCTAGPSFAPIRFLLIPFIFEVADLELRTPGDK